MISDSRRETRFTPFGVLVTSVILIIVSLVGYGIYNCHAARLKERHEYREDLLFHRLGHDLHEVTIPVGKYFDYRCSIPLVNGNDGIAFIVESDIPVRTGIQVVTDTGIITYYNQDRTRQLSDEVEGVRQNTDRYQPGSLGIRIYNEDSIPITIETNAAAFSMNSCTDDHNADGHRDMPHPHYVIMEASCIADDVAATEGSE